MLEPEWSTVLVKQGLEFPPPLTEPTGDIVDDTQFIWHCTRGVHDFVGLVVFTPDDVAIRHEIERVILRH